MTYIKALAWISALNPRLTLFSEHSMKFRKRPVVIEAHRWNGSDDCGPAWFLAARAQPYVAVGGIGRDGDVLRVSTLEGIMRAEMGDWIIKGVKGELYPCKPDIFDATYEAVS